MADNEIWTGGYYQYDPPGIKPAIPAQATAAAEATGSKPKTMMDNALKSSIQQILKGSEATENDVLVWLADHGVDVEDPEVQEAAVQGSTIAAFKAMQRGEVVDGASPDSFMKWVYQPLKAAHPTMIEGVYSTAMEQYGFSQMAGVEEFTTAAGSRFGPPAQPAMVAMSGTENVDYMRQTDTGAIIFPNGVIAVPGTDEVYFPGDSSVVGSPDWMREAQQNWGEDEIKAWKATLVEAGYLPKSAAKDGTWTQTFASKLAQYNRDKYLNWGMAPPTLDPDSGGYGPGGANESSFMNLRAIKGAVANDVVNQYKLMYGEEPTPEEMDRWIEFVIRTGNKLQRSKEMAAGAAGEEAVFRMGQQLRYSPYGEWMADSQENTELRDRMQAAASATRRIMEGY